MTNSLEMFVEIEKNVFLSTSRLYNSYTKSKLEKHDALSSEIRLAMSNSKQMC